MVEAVFSKGVESDPFSAALAGADKRQGAETREEELCRSSQVRWVQVLVAGGTVWTQCVTVLCDAVTAEQVSTWRLDGIGKQVITYLTRKGTQQVRWEVLGDQLGVQMVPLALCDVLYPLSSLNRWFDPFCATWCL